MKKIENALVILAGGMGSRFGKELPKQFIQINGENLIHFFLKRIDTNNFGIILIVYKSSYFKHFKNLRRDFPLVKFLFANAGKNRQLSSFNALKKLSNYNPKKVLIHDAARPFCSNKLIVKLLKQLNNKYSAIPYISNHDKIISSKEEVRNNIKFIQTPQAFQYKVIYDAHKKTLLINAKDDSALINKNNIHLIKGEKLNIKITYPEDLNYFKLFSKSVFKTGIGYDIHRINFKSKTGLKLCGIKIDSHKLIGHSDADVGIHAVCDSIFGALSMKDIGYYFSNNSSKWKNKNSVHFLKFARDNLNKKNYYIVNLDINFICESPNINKYRNKMIIKLASILRIPKKIISIKATSNEKIGFIGDGLGIAAESIVQISNEKSY
jgi:2-C-methyl-D-erythritol 4-phosphate cytidylyltransferase / 2-C-methyl-D-erythritol 2,4-cyclodiphosphate synthase